MALMTIDERGFIPFHSCQRESAFRQQLRKPLAGEKGVFLLAHGREVVEALQFGIDEAGMAHHHAAVGQAVQERCEHGVIGDGAPEIIGAGKARIGGDAEDRAAPAHAPAEHVEQMGLGMAAAASRSGEVRPHCLTQAAGVRSFITASSASPTCGNR